MSNTSNPNVHIFGLEASDGKRYAIVGTVNVHASVFELKHDEKMADAIKKQQDMVKRRDPKLKKQTTSMVFFWAEDDETREVNRIALFQQVATYLSKLGKDGSSVLPKDAFELTDDMLKSASEKGTVG